MADLAQHKLLNLGITAWNDWQHRNIATGKTVPPINLDSINLARAVLDRGLFAHVNFSHSILLESSAHFADFQHADFRHSNLNGASFTSARFNHADLRGAEMIGTVFARTQLTGANVRTTIVGDGVTLKVSTDLTRCKGLTQEQLDSMNGDVWTKIPENLVYPKHWDDVETYQQGHLNPSGGKHRQISANTIKEYARSNKQTIDVIGTLLLVQLDAFIHTIIGKNSLEPDAKQELLSFLHQHRSNITSLIEALPETTSEYTDDNIKPIETKFNQYVSHLKRMIEAVGQPQELAETTVVLASLALGTAFGQPLAGLGAGVWITGKMTSGKYIEKLLKTDKSSTNGASDEKE